MKGEGFDSGSSVFKNGERKHRFKAEQQGNDWCVVINKVVVRTGFTDENHAKMMAQHLNNETEKKVTECCVGGCYLCDS